LNDNEKELRERIFSEIRPIILADSSLAGAETRKIIYDIVAAKYGTEDVTCRTGTSSGPSLTHDGRQAYNAMELLLKKISDKVRSVILGHAPVNKSN
jgi:hypothetical protein